MNSVSAPHLKSNGELTRSQSAIESVVNITCEVEAKQRTLLVQWLNSILPNLNFPITASDEELRACLIDGNVFCQILNRLRPVSVNEEANYSYHSSMSNSENVRRFFTTVEKLGIPRFEMSDLEKGSMKPVINCLLTLRAEYITGGDNIPMISTIANSGSRHGDALRGTVSPLFGKERQKVSSPVMSEQSALLHHVGQKFHEVFS